MRAGVSSEADRRPGPLHEVRVPWPAVQAGDVCTPARARGLSIGPMLESTEIGCGARRPGPPFFPFVRTAAGVFPGVMFPHYTCRES